MAGLLVVDQQLLMKLLQEKLRTQTKQFQCKPLRKQIEEQTELHNADLVQSNRTGISQHYFPFQITLRRAQKTRSRPASCSLRCGQRSDLKFILY